MIPSEIDGFKTDVVESAVPTYAADDVGDVDDDKRERPLLGGTRLHVALSEFSGTLGFFAIQDSPNGEVVAVTNWHVIAAGNGTNTNLVLTLTPAPGTVAVKFAKADSRPIPIGSIAYFNLNDFGPGATLTGFDFYVQSVAQDTPVKIAERMRDAINALGAPGIVATLAGDTVNVTTNNAALLEARAYGPTRPDPNCELHATATDDTISLSGAVTGEGYGLFVAVNFSSAEHATESLFLTVSKGQTPETIISRLAQDWRDRNPIFTAAVNGRSVTLSPADQIDVFAWRDIRAGQPSNNLATGCSDCCVDEIGPTIAADYGLDAALVLLDSNRVSTYLAEVKDVGYIVGAHTVTPAEIMVPYVVKKRGVRTGVRSGIVEALDVDGIIGPDIEIPGRDPALPKLLYAPRKYDGAMRIRHLNSSTILFSNSGDSGSAILREVTSGGYEVVGLLFGRELVPTIPPTTPPTNRTVSLAMPIQPILDRFNIRVAVATALDQEKTVPPRQGTSPSLDEPVTGAGTPIGEIWQRVAALSDQLSVTSTGRAHVGIIRQNLREVNRLVNKNRRVGVAWQRNGGPIIMQRFLAALRDPDCPLPTEIMGETWQERLKRIAEAVRPHASEGLQRDLAGPAWHFLLSLGGTTTREVTELLERADRFLETTPQRDSAQAVTISAPPAE